MYVSLNCAYVHALFLRDCHASFYKTPMELYKLNPSIE